MEVNKISFGAKWSNVAPKARKAAHRAMQDEQGMTRVNREMLTKMKSKQKLVTAENLQGDQVKNSARNYPYGHSGGCCTVPLTESCPW